MVAIITQDPEDRRPLVKWEHWDCMKWLGDARAQHLPKNLRETLASSIHTITDIANDSWRKAPIEEIICEHQSRGALDCSTYTLTATTHILKGTKPDTKLCQDTTRVDRKMEYTRYLLQNHCNSETEEYASIHHSQHDTTAVEWSMDDTQGKDNPPPKRFEHVELSRIGDNRKIITDDIIQTMIPELLILGPTSTLALVLHRELDSGIDDQLWRQLPVGRQERMNQGTAHEMKCRFSEGDNCFYRVEEK